MPRSYIFLIHGVGKQPADSWSTLWKDGLISALRQYAPYDKQTPEDIQSNVLRFVPIGYDSIFEGYRRRWADLAGALSDSEVIEAGALKDALTWIKNDEDDGIRDAFWSYALDAVLWFGLPQARAAIISAVLDQAVKGVKEMLEENQGADRAHWVAHSLGTSVLHDCLISLRFAEQLHEGGFDPANLRWQSVSMVANTSRLLQARRSLSKGVALEEFHPYRSRLKPGSPTSITRSYHNFHHRLDPITWPKQFNPIGFTSGYSDDETQHFKNPGKVHDLEHYLENPLVHLKLLRTFLGNEQLGTAEEVNRVAKSYVLRYPLTGSKPFSELRDLFGDNADNPLSVTDVAKFLSRAYKALKEAR